MKVSPISEEQANSQSSSLWPAGEYDYEVKEAIEGTSKAGNEMISMQVWLFDANGGRKMVFDYLLSDKAAWKVRHFAASCDMMGAYEAGELNAEDIVGRTGRCNVGTQPAQNGYEARNTIKDYIMSKTPSPAMSKAKLPADDLDDGIPF